ncbi:unnamed protein product [Closterium sp. NIES-53]
MPFHVSIFSTLLSPSPLVQCCTLPSFRYKPRRRYGLPAEPCTDLLMHWCCCICAISPQYRELKNRS